MGGRAGTACHQLIVYIRKCLQNLETSEDKGSGNVALDANRSSVSLEISAFWRAPHEGDAIWRLRMRAGWLTCMSPMRHADHRHRPSFKRDRHVDAPDETLWFHPLKVEASCRTFCYWAAARRRSGPRTPGGGRPQRCETNPGAWRNRMVCAAGGRNRQLWGTE